MKTNNVKTLAAFAAYARSIRESGETPSCFECGTKLDAETVVEGKAGWYCCQECKVQHEDGYEF